MRKENVWIILPGLQGKKHLWYFSKMAEKKRLHQNCGGHGQHTSAVWQESGKPQGVDLDSSNATTACECGFDYQ